MMNCRIDSLDLTAYFRKGRSPLVALIVPSRFVGLLGKVCPCTSSNLHECTCHRVLFEDCGKVCSDICSPSKLLCDNPYAIQEEKTKTTMSFILEEMGQTKPLQQPLVCRFNTHSAQAVPDPELYPGDCAHLSRDQGLYCMSLSSVRIGMFIIRSLCKFCALCRIAHVLSPAA